MTDGLTHVRSRLDAVQSAVRIASDNGRPTHTVVLYSKRHREPRLVTCRAAATLTRPVPIIVRSSASPPDYSISIRPTLKPAAFLPQHFSKFYPSFCESSSASDHTSTIPSLLSKLLATRFWALAKSRLVPSRLARFHRASSPLRLCQLLIFHRNLF